MYLQLHLMILWRHIVTPDQVLAHFKHNVSAVAKELHISRAAIYRWVSEGAIPYDRQCQIQVATGGALTANRKHAKKKVSRSLA